MSEKPHNDTLVVLLSIDGLRPDAIEMAAPNLLRIGHEGTTATHALTITKSSTLPSHAAMVSGVDVDQHGLNFNAYRPKKGHIHFPTVFRIAKKSNIPTSLIVAKRKLEHLVEKKDDHHFEVGGAFCNRVNKAAFAQLENQATGLMFMHYAEPDSAGHRHGWMTPKYLKAVARADKCANELSKKLAARSQNTDTLLLVTADHGGHGKTHGSVRLVDRKIPWITWGTLAPKQKTIERPLSTKDTAATVLYALGLQHPRTKDLEGTPILDAIKGRNQNRTVDPEDQHLANDDANRPGYAHPVSKYLTALAAN